VEDNKQTRCFLCECYGEISDVVDLESIRKGLEHHPRIVSCEKVKSLCLEENIDELAKRIPLSPESRVLLGACSFLARGDAIITGLQKRGIDPKHIELVDLREGCAWIHRDDPASATKKAGDLINMGIAALVQRNYSEDLTIEPKQEVLVIGAGPAGISAAASLVKLGITVHLLDRAKTPGGLLNLIKKIAPETDGTPQHVEAFLYTVGNSPLVRYYPGSRISAVRGSAGDFTVEFTSGSDVKSINVGAVIIATGARVNLPGSLYRYKELKGVITGIELERSFKGPGMKVTSAVFIQCVGVRDADRPYCSAICCPVSLKQAIQLLEENPDAEVTILHRDIMCPGSVLEDYYRKAMEAGVRFVRYDQDTPPGILGAEQVEEIRVYDVITGRERRIDAELVVLSSPLIPHDDAARVAELFDLNRDIHGFYEVRSLMHPLETTKDGVLVCGSARWPVLARTAILQGEAAAMKAFALLNTDQLTATQISQFKERKFSLALVDRQACTGCGNCVAICPYDACSLEADQGAYKSTVSQMRCTGCGSCVSVCPNGSIQLPEQNALLIGEMLKAAFS